MGKRFVCCVVDMILVAIVAELIFFGSFRIATNTKAYKDATEAVNEEVAYYNELTKQTHIVEYVDGERVSTDVIVLKNLYRAICLSYETFGNDQQPDFVFDSNHDVMINGTHSPESDNIAYFYTRYLKSEPSVNVAVSEDLFEIYKRSFGDDALLMFTFNREVSEIPVLNTQVAYYLFHYLFVNESDSIGQAGAGYYQIYADAYSRMLEEAEELIIESEPYNSTHYARYKEAYCTEARCTNIALVISIAIACFIALFIPRCLFGDGRTIAYRLFGLGVIGKDGSKTPWYASLIRTLLNCIGFIPIAFILYLLPPFSGGYEAMFVPVNPESRVSLAMLTIIIVAVGGIVNAFGLFVYNRQNLTNMIFDDIVVDVHYLDEGEREEKYQGRDY